jgi:hypothetical protein
VDPEKIRWKGVGWINHALNRDKWQTVEHSSKFLGSVKYERFPDYMTNYQFIKKDPVS